MNSPRCLKDKEMIRCEDMSNSTFLHGVEILDGKPKPTPLKLSNQGVIGIVGTAPKADAVMFPLDTPVLIAGSEEEADLLKEEGTLPQALKSIFSQCLAQVIVVRVEGEDKAAELNAVLGGYDGESGKYSGLSALKEAKGKLGISPKILIAPGYSQESTIANEMLKIAATLGASVIIDGPSTSDAAAIAYAGEFKDADNIYLIDPKLKVPTLEGHEEREASPYVAAVMAGQSYAESPSNITLKGVSGVTRSVDFRHGDANCRANLLNASYVSTIIREEGFRLWGNRATSGAFLTSYRIKDYMREGLNAVFFPYIDRGLTEAKVDYLLIQAGKFLSSMVSDGALRYGRAYAPPERNTAEQRAAGRLVVLVDYEDVSPMERVTIELNYEAQA